MPGNPVIGLVTATMLETVPLIGDLALREWESEPFVVYGDDRIALIISGIGRANAAMACAYLIQTRRPALVCNLGASGATDRQCRLGESYHIARVIEPDRPDLRSGLPHEQVPDVLDGFALATLATQDKPLRDPAERGKVAMHAQLADMEGAAVVQACRRFHVKCFLFKFVSDTPDHRQSDDIVRNIELYRDTHSLFFKDFALPRLLSLIG
ncbi:MAG: hypothetical protein A2X96_02195 [Syntrophobacterales bacterium GWC2_56_13]|nr:MAG: hypothetical protein A2X96_02195 [Syntrophobacterales bacterium GWC2_56_13]OHE21036.1 MAG: hypothetical protein A2X95_03690 [Syntrophobacterales bacterium GWF2_56_9]